ncbi:MAG: hypothetical protein QNI99_07635 [Woeseiaceae bacterium]|nr:hypothetical protein [Woeseiaceae bacterium]
MGNGVYILAAVALVVAIVAWRTSTTKFLAEFDRASRFSYPFVLDLHVDLFKALRLAVANRRFVAGVVAHGLALIAMWACIISGPEWSWQLGRT